LKVVSYAVVNSSCQNSKLNMQNSHGAEKVLDPCDCQISLMQMIGWILANLSTIEC
jgi:hypothetical protein